MDLNKALRELYDEKKRLDRVIARVETRLAKLSDVPQRSTRGRKSMGLEERERVSARMSAYWAAQRARAQRRDQNEHEKDKLPAPEETEPGRGENGISA